MPQTSRVIRGETQKRFMFGTPGLLQFSGLLDHIFGLCTCLAKVWNWTPLFIQYIESCILFPLCLFIKIWIVFRNLWFNTWNVVFLACWMASEALLALAFGDCRNDLTFINWLQKHCWSCGVYLHSVGSTWLVKKINFGVGDCVALV